MKGTFLAENESRRTVGEASCVVKGLKELRSGAVLTRCLSSRMLRVAMKKTEVNCVSGRAKENEQNWRQC